MMARSRALSSGARARSLLACPVPGSSRRASLRQAPSEITHAVATASRRIASLCNMVPSFAGSSCSASCARLFIGDAPDLTRPGALELPTPEIGGRLELGKQRTLDETPDGGARLSCQSEVAFWRNRQRSATRLLAPDAHQQVGSLNSQHSRIDRKGPTAYHCTRSWVASRSPGRWLQSHRGGP